MSLNALEPKDPDDHIKYSVNWTRRMTELGDTIASSSWPVIDDGITLDDHTFTSTTTTAWFSGGTAGNVYRATNRIVTVGDGTHTLTLDRTIEIRVLDR